MQPKSMPLPVEEEIARELTELALFFHQNGQRHMYRRLIAIRDQLWDALDEKV